MIFKNTDALTLLSNIGNNTVDLVFVDPPYLIARETGFSSVGDKGVERFAVDMDFGAWDRANTIEEHTTLMSEVMREYYRVLKKGGTMICWYDLWKIESLKTWTESAGFKQLRFFEWVKTNPVPLNSKRNYLTNSREVGITAVKGGSPTFHSEYDNGIYSAPIHRDGGKRIHPTQKPLGISEDIIRKHSNPGDIVLDTFAGSGTHLLAALQTGRKALGCERDKGYYTKARRRINRATKEAA